MQCSCKDYKLSKPAQLATFSNFSSTDKVLALVTTKNKIITMDQAMATLNDLLAKSEVYSQPAAKLLVPLGAAYLASKVLGTFWRRFLGPLLLGEVKWR